MLLRNLRQLLLQTLSGSLFKQMPGEYLSTEISNIAKIAKLQVFHVFQDCEILPKLFDLERCEFITTYCQTQNFFWIAKNPSLGVFSKCISHYLCPFFFFLIVFCCWSGHVFSSLWSNISKVKSAKDRSLKRICYCHCIFVFVVVFSLVRSWQRQLRPCWCDWLGTEQELISSLQRSLVPYGRTHIEANETFGAHKKL